MTILEQLNEDMKGMMKAKDRESLKTVRMLKSALQNEQLSKQADLTEEEEIAVLSREKKQRMDSLEEFKSANRDDLASKTEDELEIVNRYLPEQLSEEEIEDIVKETIDQTGAKSMQDMCKVMGAIMPKVKGRADGGLVNKIVKDNLS